MKYLNRKKKSKAAMEKGLDSGRCNLKRGQKEGEKQKWEVGGKRERVKGGVERGREEKNKYEKVGKIQEGSKREGRDKEGGEKKRGRRWEGKKGGESGKERM